MLIRLKGQKRGASVLGNTVRVMRIATGEEPEDGQAEATKERGRDNPRRPKGACSTTSVA